MKNCRFFFKNDAVNSQKFHAVYQSWGPFCRLFLANRFQPYEGLQSIDIIQGIAVNGRLNLPYPRDFRLIFRAFIFLFSFSALAQQSSLQIGPSTSPESETQNHSFFIQIMWHPFIRRSNKSSRRSCS